jgi:uncharacterized OB-fold protein
VSGTIVAAAIARPSGRLGPLAVEGPDEDGFTLAVAAAEALGARNGPDLPSRIELVGDLPADAEWMVPEALGISEVAVHRTLGGPANLFEAVRGHESAGRERPRLVLAVDGSRAGRGVGASHGALAVALAIGAGTGVTVEHVAAHVRAAGATDPGLRSDRLGARPGADPVQLLLLGESDRLVAAARVAGELGFAPSVVPQAPPGTGPAPTTPFALALRAMTIDGPHRPFVLAGLGPDWDLHVRGTVSGAVAWSEAPSSPPVQLSAPPVPDDPRRLDARSEGAYLPRPRYVENLPSRWRLEGDWCPSCGSWTFPSRGACAKCGDSHRLERRALSRTGWTVEAATTVRPGAQPTELDPLVASSGAYGVVIARSAEGPRGTFQVAGPALPIALGAAIAPVLRRLYPMEGEWRYGRKAILGAHSPDRPRGTPP